MQNDIAIEPQAAGRSETRGMKLVVLGATGGTGLEIVRKAIERGHSVTAFVRSPERLKPFQDRITVRQGDLLNSVELERIIQGHDAVVSGFGPPVPMVVSGRGPSTPIRRRSDERHVACQSPARRS